MTLELLKVICQVVVIERDEAGSVTGERYSDPVPIYDVAGLDAFIAKVHADLAYGNDNGHV